MDYSPWNKTGIYRSVLIMARQVRARKRERKREKEREWEREWGWRGEAFLFE